MESEGGNPRVLLIFGLTAGVVQTVAGITMYMAGVYFAATVTLISVTVLLLCIVVGMPLELPYPISFVCQ